MSTIVFLSTFLLIQIIYFLTLHFPNKSPFIQHVFINYYMQGIVVGAEDTTENKTEKK